MAESLLESPGDAVVPLFDGGGFSDAQMETLRDEVADWMLYVALPTHNHSDELMQETEPDESDVAAIARYNHMSHLASQRGITVEQMIEKFKREARIINEYD